MSRRLLSWLRILGTILLFGYVMLKAGLLTQDGWSRLLLTLRGTDFALVLLAILFNLVLDLISAFKWWILSKSLALRGSHWALFSYYLSARFFNLVLPSNIGGDVIRISLQGRLSGETALSAAAVFMDRLTGFITLVGLALLAAAMSASALQLPYMGAAIAISLAGAVILVWMVVDARPLDIACALAVRVWPRSTAITGKLQKLHDAVGLYKRHKSGLLLSFLVSLLFYAACACNLWLNIAVFDSATPFMPILIATPLIMVIMNIPLSVGNVGVTEFAYTIVLSAFGVPPSVALSAALLHRLKTFASAGMGAILYNVVKMRDPGLAEAPLAAPSK